MGDDLSGTTGSGSGRPGVIRGLKWAVLFAALSLGLVRSSSADESSPAGPSLEDVLGTFDEDGKLHNQTEKTYRLPDMGAFVAYYPGSETLATGILVELHDKKHRPGALNWFKYDLMISEQRLGLALGRKVFPVIDITISAVYSRDFERNDSTWGFALSLIDF